jgi:hypothetical protein
MHPLASQARFEADVEGLTDALATRRGWILHCISYPVIDCAFAAPGRTGFRIRLTCDNWNDLPPSVALLAADGTLLGQLPPNPTGVFNQGPHPATHRPFVCMRGAREYHTHPSHVGDPWEAVKGTDAYSLGGILTQLWRAWGKGSG